MQPIRTVAVQGAGAMGAYFAGKFFDTPGFSVSLIAQGERAGRLARDGLIINGRRYDIPVIDPESAGAQADLIIVALKHHHLAEAVHDLKHVIGPRTIILSVMNGLGSEEYIGSVYGLDKILYAVSVGIDAVREGNRIEYTAGGTHYFGEADNTELNPKVLRVREAFDKAGIHYKIPEDMLRILWWKFMINVGINQASAVMGAPYGVFQRSADAHAFMESLMREAVALAKAADVDLREEDLQEWFSFLRTLSPEGKTSMLQDIEAGRKTEVEIFAGKAVEMGTAHNIPTPVNAAVLRIIHVLEEMIGATPIES
ncbi:MAG: ketopantoate reductase family protein [Sediminispirochaetaceae bacterium]